MITYCYCDRCGKPVDRSDADQNKYIFCKECAIELYQKIFKDNDRQK